MNCNLLSEIYCLDRFIVVRKHIKVNEKTSQAQTLNIEQPRPWKPNIYHFSNHPRTIKFCLCFASQPAMPFCKIHPPWLPYGKVCLAFVWGVGFFGGERGKRQGGRQGGRGVLLDLNNSLVSQPWKQIFRVFDFLLCPCLVSKWFVTAERNCYTHKC